MAQFSIPELGSGQWMQGGMTMCGDMFNTGLQSMVSNLCGELSSLMANTQVLQPAPQGTGSNAIGGGSWWPSDLGSPNSSGGQNGMQYAYFSSARRLAINTNGEISIYDTLDHQIGGVQQQQGGGSSLTFTSQYGTFSSLNLPLISGPGKSQPTPPTSTLAPAPAPVAEPAPAIEVQQPAPASNSNPVNTEETLKSIQQLGELHQAGILTEYEFSTKKAELLNRL